MSAFGFHANQWARQGINDRYNKDFEFQKLIKHQPCNLD